MAADGRNLSLRSGTLTNFLDTQCTDQGSRHACSGESTRLPPIWLGVNSFHGLGVEFVVGSHPRSKRFFSGYSYFPVSLNLLTSRAQRARSPVL